MALVSGFTFIHNAIESGYPIVECIDAVRPFVFELVVVDCQSTDGTRDLLEKLDVRIIDGEWWQGAGETLRLAHSQYAECDGDIILHFEADEYYDPRLAEQCVKLVGQGVTSQLVWRLQVSQNFQRIRWYPELVHRVFPKNAGIVKVGHTTNQHDHAIIIGMDYGYLWDCTNIFRDSWLKRVQNQAWLWNERPQYRAVRYHMLESPWIEDYERFLREPHWTWEHTPLDIPDGLKHLVGQTKYNAEV